MRKSKRGPSLVSDIEIVHISHHRDSVRTGCVATERLLPFQVPRRGTCMTAGPAPSAQRYLSNHGHQAEVLIPIIDESVVFNHAPSMIHWSWPRAHWTKEVLGAMLPFTRVVTSATRPSHVCRRYYPIGSHGGARSWLRTRQTADLMRRAMAKHCGLRDWAGADDGTRRRQERVVVLLRGDSQQVNVSNASSPAPERRAFAHLPDVMRWLRAALPTASVQVETTRAHAPICTQARWVHGAAAVLSPHGAHLLNALWMPRGAALLEVMPWAMWDYEGYSALFKAAELRHAKIRAARPPPTDAHWTTANGRQEHSQRRCAMTEGCRMFYRGQSRLHFGLHDVCRALRGRLPSVDHPSSACARSRA